ncbi:MAG: thioether cross-link-forming SCIFF peptide maturase [Oscillospiraceae bacterium]|nr:thioether cross-link-forming SCIFF peptide maturase [Oscillospiraceae bacterium]
MNNIHKFTLNGYYIVLDVPSGAIHSVDELTYELLGIICFDEHGTPVLPPDANKTLTRYSRDEIDETFAEIYELYQDGLLFSTDERVDESVYNTKNATVKALCLHIAHDCNLRCKYCFADKGTFGQEKEWMRAETGIAAIDFLAANSSFRTNLEVDFFGGEPLMNYEVVRTVVDYARGIEKDLGRRFRFTLTTNGLALNDAIIEHINREIDNVVLSLDGRREVNDRMRPRIDGKSSYDIVVEKFQKLVKLRRSGQSKSRSVSYPDYFIRGTFTRNNLDFCEDVLHIDGLGFDHISIEPAIGINNDFVIGEQDLPIIFDEYERLAKLLIKKERIGKHICFFHFNLDLSGGPCLLKRLKGCGAGVEYLAVTPSGDIYPCHQFVGIPEWQMGNVHTGKLDVNKKTTFSKTSIYEKKGCADCWARYFCSGGCNANNYKYAQDILTPYNIECELQKKRLECAIMMNVSKG